MLPFIILLAVVLMNWRAFRNVARRLAPQRVTAATLTAGEQSASRASLPTPLAAESGARTLEPTARAFPIEGLPPGPGSARELEQLLQRLAGVTGVYVSPVTAFAYVDFLPTEVTEEHLAQAMERGGYQVGAEADRFTWRHPYQR